MPTRTAVLLVEDNPDDADTLRELLRDARAPVRLTGVETLAAAVDALGREPFALILLDLSLPDSQGLATVERALAAAPHLPILVLTGLEDEALGAAAVHAGAQDYLVKGQSDGAALMRAMRYAIERHRLLAARNEDVEVWAALAHGGEALLAASGGQGMLDTLGRVAIEALGCDRTSVWMLDRTGRVYRPVAARPLSEWQRLADTSLARESCGALAASGGEAAQWLTPALRGALPAALLPAAGDALYLAFVSGGALDGFQVCGFAARPPGTATARIAAGLVHVAGLALGNARLIDELERSNTVKTYFAATMSHELRNTLFAIGGFGDMLHETLAQQPGGEDARRMARVIGQRARDSLALIQAALELTRSEVRSAPEPQPVEVAAVLRQVAAETRVPVDKPELRVEWAVADALPVWLGDEVKLTMILKNLIGNAIKFSERGRVRVSAEAAGAALRLVIADTGIGIDPEDLPTLFQPFRQAHGARSRRAGGAGLGLYIVARLVELLGGTIAVESHSGTGTTFEVTLPLAPHETSRAIGD